MSYLSHPESKRAQDTIDPLLDYVEAHSPLSPEGEAVVYEAWSQHDLYPRRSGEEVRSAIVAMALSKLIELNVERVGRARYVLLPEKASRGVKELVACHG